MSFVLDQQTVFNEFTQVIAPEISDQLRPHVAGPHGALHRYSDPLEKAGASLGPYQPGSALTYGWPGRRPGSKVDLNYARLWLDNALLLFFSDAVGAPAAAVLRARSASGRDDVPNVTPAAFGAATNVGTRGLRVTFSLNSAATPDAGVTPNEFVAGQAWQVVVRQAYTAPAIAGGGTYTGTEKGVTITYVVSVTAGGTLGGVSPPQ